MTAWLRSLSRRAEFALITGITLGVLVVSAVSYVVFGVTTARFSTSSAVGLAAYEICTLVVAGAILRARGWHWRSLELRPSLRNTWAGCGVFVFAYMICWLFMVMARLVTGGWEFAETVTLERTASLPAVVLISAVNPVFEETIVVGYLVRFFEREGAWIAIGASALIRSSYHLYQGSMAAIVILPLGIVYATIFWRRRELWRLVVAHAAMDFWALAANGTGG